MSWTNTAGFIVENLFFIPTESILGNYSVSDSVSENVSGIHPNESDSVSDYSH